MSGSSSDATRPISGSSCATKSSALFTAALAFFTLLIVFFVFSGILPAHGFVYDDRYLLLENPYLKDWKNLFFFFTRDVTEASGLQAVSGYYRPLSMILLQGLYHLFGLTAWKYHAFSLLMHAVNSFFCGWLAWRFSGRKIFALASAALFAAHPVHNDVVIPLYSYMALSSGAAALFSVFSYWRGIQTKRAYWYFLSVLFYAAALFFKEDILFLPVFLFFLNDTPEGWRAKFRVALDLLPWCAAAGLYLVMRFLFVNHGAAFGFWGQTTLENLDHPGGWFGFLIGIPMTWLGYLKLWVWPHPLSPFHMLAMPSRFIAWIGFGGALIFVLILILKMSRDRFLKLAWIWFFVFLFPVLNIIPIGGMFNERHLYLPSMGLTWLSVWAIYALSERFPKRIRVFAGHAIVGAATLFCAFLAVQYSTVWLSDDALWRRGHQVYPQAADPLNKLAKAFYDAGDLKSAAEYYVRAADLERYPAREVEYRRKAAQAFGLKGEFEPALEQYQRLLKLNPDHELARFELGWTYFLKGDLSQAEKAYRDLLVRFPDSARGYYGLSELAFKRGDFEEGKRQSGEALQRHPNEALVKRILSNLRQL